VTEGLKDPAGARDPLWFKDAIIYELHVRAFYDSNNDGIGDFPGLIQKLDYLCDLGVTCLWLLPFFPSPLRDDGYDIADYRSVHPSYGTLDDFRAFLGAAHERGLQVMIELVINHTSDQHPWFQEARLAPAGSPERDFYVWSDTVEKFRDARIIFTDTEKSNWTWDPVAKSHYWHRFFSHQPDLNYDNPAVQSEIEKVMRFWLDLGVDGLRMDAIPYLIEREGTNCENLPETHAVVKKLRAAMDAHYENRMILAEANQWPTDVRTYFGDGDECHMAFHFPLMPRLFMALRLEDRHPITDIIAQTPNIPANCQWGLFLRNHDELTLEMVTDEERDYMYLAYSADPQMRINVGIRRRLAPLMDNNRRRIELLTGLLFSFPGTPILYYGDEIGMGDNIYLGDRNGVRTPMQWNADRNAGFSRATPAKLYSPMILDPVYGYEALNVEAQHADSSSLLNWMRHMIALRKLFRVFGRGSIEFFEPANRKVLAYIRRSPDEQILCVANLSRFAQPFELDLSAYAGLTPIEMLGYVEFPKITAARYSLTLGPYGFLWFELHGKLESETDRKPEAEEWTLALAPSDGWEGLFGTAERETLEAHALPKFLPHQRWFGSKTRSIRTARVKDWVCLPDSQAALTLVQVEYDEGAAELYSVPLSLAMGEAASAVRSANPGMILSEVRKGATTGVLYDATADEQAARALLTVIRENSEVRGAAGRLLGGAGAILLECAGSAADLQVRRGGAEQSNTSIFFGTRFVMKLYRRLENGPNPDCEMNRYLSAKAGFDGVPGFGGELKYRAGGSHLTIAMVQELVENQGDGWQSTLEELARYFEQCAAGEKNESAGSFDVPSLGDLWHGEIPPSARERLGLFYDSAVNLGRRTAEMHLALGSPADDPAFGPEPFESADLQKLAGTLREHAATVFDLLKNALARLPDAFTERASFLLSKRRQVLAALANLATLEVQCAKIRIHGDYHLGQVLLAAGDHVILDFEGEPARSLAERRAKQSPLKDVAGMLRSFSYASQAAMLAYSSRRSEDVERIEPWARYWERIASAAFLRSYCHAAGGAAFLPNSPAGFRRLLDAFMLDKAMYELRYELDNRPAWLGIPLAGILSLDLTGDLAG
jgi:maltose alpha-D-glucosyltransferase/alpha-amylase